MKVIIDTNINADDYNIMCEDMYSKYSGPDYKKTWNGKIVMEDVEHTTESFYTDTHGTGHLAKEVINPEASYLDRYTLNKEHPVHEQIKKICGLSVARITINIQHPGNFIPEHIDRHRSLLKDQQVQKQIGSLLWTDIKRFIYFWDDQFPGQFFQIGKVR